MLLNASTATTCFPTGCDRDCYLQNKFKKGMMQLINNLSNSLPLKSAQYQPSYRLSQLMLQQLLITSYPSLLWYTPTDCTNWCQLLQCIKLLPKRSTNPQMHRIKKYVLTTIIKIVCFWWPIFCSFAHASLTACNECKKTGSDLYHSIAASAVLLDCFSGKEMFKSLEE